MKKSIFFADWRVTLLFVMSYFMPIYNADAAAPTEQCPNNYTAIELSDIVLANADCPSDYVSIGAADSCLVSEPNGVCIMYAPAGVTYTDETGSYEYSEACEYSGDPIDGEIESSSSS